MSIKKVLLVVGLMTATSLCCLVSYADTDTAAGLDSVSSHGRGGGRRGGGKKMNIGKASKNPGTIRGSCTVVESPSNPFANTCVNILLILRDQEGNEVSKSRTTSKGEFEFATDTGKLFRLESGSRFYAVVAPKDLIHGGALVNLKLQQKE